MYKAIRVLAFALLGLTAACWGSDKQLDSSTAREEMFFLAHHNKWKELNKHIKYGTYRGYSNMINDVRMSDNQNPTYSIFWPVKGETILHVAAKNADLKEIEFLVENGADPCKLDFDLNVPAKWRAKGQIVFDPKNDKITQYLTQACKKKKEKPIEKKKPLQIEKKKPPQKTATPEQFKAAAEKLWDAVKFDIKHGTNINARDDEGRTLLHIAAAQERMDIVQWLIERGANPTLTDKNGKDPAVTSGDLDILDYIESVQKEWKKAHK